MTKRRKPEALQFTEEPGFMTFRARTPEEAEVAIRECMSENSDFDGVEVVLEKIREDVMYHHRRCGYYAVGENICGECGEPCGTMGKKTFVYYYE